MSIPKLYTVLPKKGDGSPDINVLTSLSSGVVPGSNDEKYAMLSYFPKELKLSKLSNFVLNKYVLFVLNQDETQEYTVKWSVDIKNGESSIKDRCVIEEVPGTSEFEYTSAIRYLDVAEGFDWEFTLETTCIISKNGEKDSTIELTQKLLPIESDLLSENGASFEDETGKDNSSVPLGNEGTTHFMRGHLGEYLVAKKDQENKDGSKSPNNAATFVNQTAAIAYINVMSNIDSIGPSKELPGLDLNFLNSFNTIFSNPDLELDLIMEREFSNSSYGEIGVCSLNLHHVIPFVNDTEPVRANSFDELLSSVESEYKDKTDKFIIAYHRSVFPKSAINLSVDIFDRLFTAFKEEASETNYIYETFEGLVSDQKAKITSWKSLGYSELREKSNDPFMKNLITEYYWGHYSSISSELISRTLCKQVLEIDWSQFIQKLLNPSTITIPFTLIKIQVNDLRSGKPIAHTLVSRVEFHSFKSSPNYDVLSPDLKFGYEIKTAYDSDIPFGAGDSKYLRLHKIFKSMGYYTGSYSYSKIRLGIHKYLTEWNRTLPVPIDAPASSSEDDIKVKKSAWIDYIIEDFEANCMTDGDGILNCRVPDQLLKDRKLNINVGFSEFAVVREIFGGEDKTTLSEPPIKRPRYFLDSKKTDFMAHWVGDALKKDGAVNPNEQNLDWSSNLSGGKNFGWKITEHTGLDSEDKYSSVNQLKLALPLEVKKSTSEEFNHLKVSFSDYFDFGFTIEDYSHFSTFYEDAGIHFVLYGMQWCQPVWNEYDDKELVNGNSKHSYVQDENFVHPHMHLVTNGAAMSGSFKKYTTPPYYGTNENYGGKGYGKYERNIHPDVTSAWRGGNGHNGYDIHAKIGANVFALHGGKVTYKRTTGSGGDAATVEWEKHDSNRDDEYHKIQYCHLDGDERFSPQSSEFVLAGTVVAKGGRTGNIDDESPNTNPSHVHLNVGGKNGIDDAYYPLLRRSLDKYFPENANVLPSNSSPLLYPCRGEQKKGEKWEAINGCDLKHKIFVQWCWAAGELKCPYINKTMDISNENLFQLIIQLRYLNEQPASFEKRIVNKVYKVKSEANDEFPEYFEDKPAFSKIDKNEDYFHPGRFKDTFTDATSCSEEYGTFTKVEGSTIPKGTVLVVKSTAHSNTNHSLRKVEYQIAGTKKTTWIEKELIGTDNKLLEILKNVPSTANKPSKTRMAIYCFRKQHGLIKTDNYFQNFTTDDEFWNELNNQCGF